MNVTSSYQAWGVGHLDRDTDEIGECVRYIQEYKAERFGKEKRNVVLMGHSTGSQCVLHYLYRENPHTRILPFDPGLKHVERPPVDGAIMQAPVSDREAIAWVLEWGVGETGPEEARDVYERLQRMARESEKADDSAFDTLLPLSLTSRIGYPANTPISCRRFLSLVSPDSPGSPREDDLFSSDLSDETLGKTFGMVGRRGLLGYKLMVTMSGADQSVPDWVDKEKVLSRWKNATDCCEGDGIWDVDCSGVIPGASHALSNDDQTEARKDLVSRVLGYLDGLESAKAGSAN